MSKAAELANLIGNINAGGGGVNRNVIINGAMNVSQRGTSFPSPSHADITLDQFRHGKGHDGAVTITQDSSGPNGFANSLKVDVTTADTSIAAGQYAHIFTRIEAQNLQHLKFGTSDAQNFTLSFYVKSNKTGTYALVIGQNDNSYKQASQTYTIDSANTWERKSLTFTGDTAGVINDDNGHGLEIVWWLALGSTYTSGSSSASFATYADANHGAGHAVNVLDSTDNEWLLTGVQLEVGQNATEFEHEPFERTLLKCQRYYYKIPNSGTYTRFGHGENLTTTASEIHFPFPVKMRSEPSVETTGTVSNYALYNSNSANACTSIVVESGGHLSPEVGVLDVEIGSGSITDGGSSQLMANNNSNAFIAFSAEL